MTDIKKLTDIINKSLVGKNVTFVKHRPERIYTLSHYDKPAIGFETKPCDLPEYRNGGQYLDVTVDGKPAQLRLPSVAYRRLMQALKQAEVDRSSDEPIHVWMSREGEGYRTDFRALVRKLDTEYSPGPLVEAFKAAITAPQPVNVEVVRAVKEQFNASINGITNAWRIPIADMPKPVAKAGVCQCSMRDLMSGVPHRSDCPERTGR